MVAYRF